ncbi:hypothetical protein [Salarchaeum sp. JOR-1]|uniref:hypothetical protein n=1 Tax=Salarchaeum sp. JOR-1 TaxID=2599399 RepID=UPI0011984E73|nr:hypothetical protein [Salarchaeum sp. JOR-1]QDX40152.1 hypothetical protein FQU85_04315 [Salarchaeum sp. JOR-1]
MVDETKRSMLKLAGLSIGSAVSGIRLLGGVPEIAAAASPNKLWKKRDQSTYTQNGWDYGLYHSSVVGWYGGWYRRDGQWGHDFRVESTISTRTTEEGGVVDLIDGHSIGIAKGNLETLALYTASKYHGVYPSVKDDSYTHPSFLEQLSQAAIGYMFPGVGYALTAAELVGALTPDDDRDSSTLYDFYQSWPYSPANSDASHFRWFETVSTTGTEVVFDVVPEAWNDAWGLSTRNSFTFQFTNDYEPTEGKPWEQTLSSQSISTTSTGTIVARPKPGWLVERIPYRKVQTRMGTLGWPKERINRVLGHLSERDYLYYAHQAPIKSV